MFYSLLFRGLPSLKSHIVLRDIQCVDVPREETREPIRIYYDLSALKSKSDPYQCTEVGQNLTLPKIGEDNYTHTCEEEDIPTDEDIQNIEITCSNVLSFLSQFIKVNRIIGNITTVENERFPSPSFSSYPTDLYIQVFARFNDDDNLGLAEAIGCVNDHRVSQGVISLQPNYVKINGASNVTDIPRNLFNTILHETLHLLGIKASLSSYWIDPDTNQTYEKGDVSRYYQSFSHSLYENKTINMLLTPNLKKFAQTRFGTTFFANNESHILGVELEDAENRSTVSHPEARVYPNDIMSPYSLGDLRISDLTVALLKDTNYYDVNASFAEPLSWGDSASWGATEPDPAFSYGPPQTAFPTHYLCNQEEITRTLEDPDFFVCSHDYEALARCQVEYIIYQCENPEDENMKHYCNSIDFYNPKSYSNIPNNMYFDFMPFKRFSSSCFKDNQKCARVSQGEDEQINGQCVSVVCEQDYHSYNITIDNIVGVCTKSNEAIKIGNTTIMCEDPKIYCSIDTYRANFKSMFTQEEGGGDDKKPDDDDLSGGEIAAIVVSCVVGSIGIGGGVIYGVKKSKKGDRPSQLESELNAEESDKSKEEKTGEEVSV